MEPIIFFLGGIVCGLIIFRCIWLVKSSTGDLIIVNDTDEAKPYIFLNISRENIDRLVNNQIIKLNIKKEKKK